MGLLLPVVWNVGCNCQGGVLPDNSSSSAASSGAGGSGDDFGPCGVDCSKFQTLPCTTAVCNDQGQYVGPIDTCVVIPLPKGASCDDQKFCTVGDQCDGAGVCVGGGTNTCGTKASPCEATICYEDTKTCDVTPVSEGSPCTPADLCQVNGVCHIGECMGETKDCTFSPLNECNKVACNPATGKCEGAPDPDKDDAACVLSGDICNTNKTCKGGVCQGGILKDCSALNIGCEVGECNPQNGICQPGPAPVGTACTDGIAECQVGKCDIKGDCISSQAQNGSACNDHNGCTKADQCQSGMCGGSAVAGCSHYLQSGFEMCPGTWTFGGDWECGMPSNVGPLAAHSGANVIATKIADNYSVGQTFTTSVASSPVLDLTTATAPQLSFWAWVWTEGGSFDGWKLQASADGGQNFADVTTVTPPYNLTILGKPAWGGDHSTDGWQHYTADLSALAGKMAVVRFAFRSDPAGVFPGVYIDDVFVSEPQETPMFITTTSPLADIYAGQVYSQPIMRTGGSANAEWSINQGGLNNTWITIDPGTGILSGTPLAANVGPVTLTVHVQEPALPSNFAEKTFTFNVQKAGYYTSFEGMCPDGWTLTGDWECGVPMTVGPPNAYAGAQCIATKIGANYSNLQTYNGTTAVSPDIDLTNVPSPKLTFRMFNDTEGSTYDGVNLQVSTDGGMNWVIVTNVTPPYPLTVAGKPAWGGHQAALGWQAMQADLTGYAGQTIRIRFSFQSDSSGVGAGVYIDDILIN